MQANYVALKRTYEQINVPEQADGELVFVDRVQDWLEREDSSLAPLCGYGVCALTALCLLGGILRAVIS